VHECSILHLLDLQLEKVLQLAHHAHLKFLLISSANLATRL
jgi:hypothetical protein